MTVAQLILQNGQQVCNDVQSLRQETDALIHFEVASDGLIHRLELRFHPEELWGVEHGAVQVNVDAEDEELANLHVDLGAAEVDLASESELLGNLLAGLNGGRNQLLEEGRL